MDEQGTEGNGHLKPEELDEMLDKSFWRDVLYEVIKTMDPWDIDLSELATRYSMKVEQMKEMNFRIPANVVIVSSVLLRMKSQFVGYADSGPDLSSPDFMDESDMDYLGVDFLDPEAALRVAGGNGGKGGLSPESLIVSPKRVPKRRITALELISAIQEVLEDRTLKSRIREHCSYEERNLVLDLRTDIKDLMEDTFNKVMAILSAKEEVLFSELAQTRDEVVHTLISLLHLSNKQRLKIRQEKIFEEIYIHA